MILDLVNLGQFDHINRMITLSVITLSGFHCSAYSLDVLKNRRDEVEKIEINVQFTYYRSTILRFRIPLRNFYTFIKCILFNQQTSVNRISTVVVNLLRMLVFTVNEGRKL